MVRFPRLRCLTACLVVALLWPVQVVASLRAMSADSQDTLLRDGADETAGIPALFTSGAEGNPAPAEPDTLRPWVFPGGRSGPPALTVAAWPGRVTGTRLRIKDFILLKLRI